ncbi:hypothetical protein QQF64_030684, partial [Cirrhinus molitorella]
MRNYWNLGGKQENPIGELEERKRSSEICPASTCSSEEARKSSFQTIIHPPSHSRRKTRVNAYALFRVQRSPASGRVSRTALMGVNRRNSGFQMASRGCENGLGILLIFLVDLLGITATNMEPIYWNSLNKRFSDDKGYVLYPQIGDRLDLICPASEPPGPRAPAEYEYYKLYLVSSREQADRCEVTGAPNLLLTCDKPNSDMRFTIKFQEYSPNLWGHEFKTNQDYFII